MMLIDNKFNLGEIVFLKTDEEQHERIITGITISHKGISYELCQGTSSCWHYDFEISATKDVLKVTTN